MRLLLTLKGVILIAIVAMLLAGAAIYASHLAFDVNITGNVNLVVTGDPIQVLSGDGVTLIDSGDSLDFGTAAVDFFGRGPKPVRGPFSVRNVSNGPVQVVVSGDGGDGIVPLWGPTPDTLKPATDNAFTLAAPGSGDTMMGYWGLKFLDPSAGNKSTTIIFRATAVTGDAGPTPIPPPPGMVSWWPGDGNANDIWGGNHGTLTGDATADGKVGQAFSFDGVGDFVLVADNPNLDITGDMTVDLWAKRTVFSRFMGMVVKGAAGTIGGGDVPSVINLEFSSNDMLGAFFERGDGSNVRLDGPIVTDVNFHHYAYVRSGDHHKLFMDGEVVASGDFTGSPGDTSGLPLTIGALRHDPDPTGFVQYFGGVIDEVEIFNRALTAEEVRAIYDSGSAGKVKPAPIELHAFIVDVQIPVAGGARGVIAGDVVGDGQARIVVGSNNTGYVHVFKYQGGQYIEEWSELVAEESPIIPTAIGDVDNDGQPEFLVNARGKGSIYMYKRTGDTYQLSLQQNLGGNYMPAVVVDLDRDGQNELVIDTGDI